MSQHYSDPSREHDPHALPDVETFQASEADCPHCTSTNVADSGGEYRCDSCTKGRKGYTVPKDEERSGWYWWSCFPGCLPDGDSNGPFETEADAVADAITDAQDGRFE